MTSPDVTAEDSPQVIAPVASDMGKEPLATTPLAQSTEDALTTAEIEMPTLLSSVLDSPRRVKRLLNSYWLARAMLPSYLRQRFLGATQECAQYPALMVQLAIVACTSSLIWFHQLERADNSAKGLDDLMNSMQSSASSDKEDQCIKEILTIYRNHANQVPRVEELVEYSSFARRFSFGITGQTDKLGTVGAGGAA